MRHKLKRRRVEVFTHSGYEQDMIPSEKGQDWCMNDQWVRWEDVQDLIVSVYLNSKVTRG